MPRPSARLPLIDAAKAIASQCIVLHHLAIYGPLSEAAQTAAPALFGWLASNARIAVQVFLVIAGFLAANSLAPQGALSAKQPTQEIKKRYLKLAIPFIAAVIFCMIASALARQWLVDDAIPGPPTLWQFLAHATLLHGVLGVDSLSAGVWYIAIDFQLFVLLLGLLWVARTLAPGGANTAANALVALTAVLSLFYFNRHSDWDNWALYFFGAYGIGALSYWCARTRQGLQWISLITAIVALALFVDFRSRVLVALATALLLAFGSRSGLLARWPDARLLGWLGKISYSVFLIHFPCLLLVNALFAHAGGSSGEAVFLWVMAAWAISIAAGALFYHGIERRSAGWQARLASRQQRPRV